jgi:hypothetical protein
MKEKYTPSLIFELVKVGDYDFPHHTMTLEQSSPFATTL